MEMQTAMAMDKKKPGSCPGRDNQNVLTVEPVKEPGVALNAELLPLTSPA
jgi:hypothetical protein